MICGNVIASVGFRGRWSMWLVVGDSRGPSSVSLAFSSVRSVGVTSEIAGTCPQLPMLQPWMVMALGKCIQNRGLRGSVVEGPMQDTALDWIPYPQGTEHWRARSDSDRRVICVNRHQCSMFYTRNSITAKCSIKTLFKVSVHSKMFAVFTFICQRRNVPLY